MPWVWETGQCSQGCCGQGRLNLEVEKKPGKRGIFPGRNPLAESPWREKMDTEPVHANARILT